MTSNASVRYWLVNVSDIHTSIHSFINPLPSSTCHSVLLQLLICLSRSYPQLPACDHLFTDLLHNESLSSYGMPGFEIRDMSELALGSGKECSMRKTDK